MENEKSKMDQLVLEDILIRHEKTDQIWKIAQYETKEIVTYRVFLGQKKHNDIEHYEEPRMVFMREFNSLMAALRFVATAVDVTIKD